MSTLETLWAAVETSYDNLFGAITELAKNPDDDDCARCEGIAHSNYNDAYEAYITERLRQDREDRKKGILPF